MNQIFESILDPYYMQVLTLLGIYIIAALGLNLITGATGMFSFGHAAYFAVGAYGAAILTVNFGFPFYIALVAGGLMASLAAIIIGFPALRLTGDYLGIVTLGFGEIIRVVFLNMKITGGAIGLSGIAKETNLSIVIVLVMVTVYIMYALDNSRFGRALVAIREDDIAAESMGINVMTYKMKAFALGCFFAGIAGGLYSHLILYINPSDFGFAKSFEFLCFVVLGGLGSIPGVILGTTVLTLAPEFLRAVADYRMMIYGALMVFMMIIRPKGLLGDVNLHRIFFKKKYQKQANRSTAAGG